MRKIKHKDAIGFEIRTLSNLLMRKMVAEASNDNIDETAILHGWIIAYLYDHQEQEVFQRDVETKFSLARPSVTCVVKSMEKKGYLFRESVPYDARLKKLVLTDKGIDLHIKNKETIDRLEDRLKGCLTDEEVETFLHIARKLKESLNNDLYG